MFHFHGRPVSAQDAAYIISQRHKWHRDRLGRLRDFDELHSSLWRQLWAIIRGRL